VEAVTDTETIDEWKNDKLLQEIQYELCDIQMLMKEAFQYTN